MTRATMCKLLLIFILKIVAMDITIVMFFKLSPCLVWWQRTLLATILNALTIRFMCGGWTQFCGSLKLIWEEFREFKRTITGTEKGEESVVKEMPNTVVSKPRMMRHPATACHS